VKPGENTNIFLRFVYLLVSIVLLTAVLFGWIEYSNSSAEIPPIVIEEPRLNIFGFNSDSLEHQTYTVLKNETLSDILLNLRIPANKVAQIVENVKPVLDVRKITAGSIYHIFVDNDSLKSLIYFVYEKTMKDFVVLDLSDSIYVYESEKEVTVKEKQKSALIDHSLYISLKQTESSPELAIRLSQIFAWQIDFHHLQKDDNFKVIYEELYIDSSFYAIGEIKAAYFNHRGKNYYAIVFVQDSVAEYFDENGNSLRKAFLKSPLDFGRISSRYSRSRLHPVLNIRRPHHGVDYAAPIGTPIKTTGDGIVTEAGYTSGNGKFIKIRHNSMYTTMYLHLSRFAKAMKKGTVVRQGQVIGYVGNTGLSTGPHLCYRFYFNGNPVDALKVELPPSHPVKEEFRAEFEAVKDSLIRMLNNIDVIIAENPV
jgi:murein DD-endopeptidase MepM/ murein hydrolase activator NlpD